MSVDSSTVIREDSLLTVYIDIAAAGTGAAFLSFSTPFVTMVDSSGVVTRQFGSPGDGPGEFRAPTSIDVQGDSVFIWEPRKRALSVFDTSGRFLTQETTDASLGAVRGRATTEYLGRPGMLRVFGSLIVTSAYVTAVSVPREQQSFALVALDTALAVIDTIWRGPLPLDANVTRQGEPTELLPVAMWGRCSEDRLVVYDPTTGTSSFRSSTGVESRQLDTPADKVSISNDDLIKDVTMQARRMLFSVRQPPPTPLSEAIPPYVKEGVANGLYPTVFQGYAGLLCDSDGRLWLEEFSLQESPYGYGRTWKVWSESGEPVSVVLPAAFRLMLLRGNRGYGVQLDSTGAEYPAWVSLAR